MMSSVMPPRPKVPAASASGVGGTTKAGGKPRTHNKVLDVLGLKPEELAAEQQQLQNQHRDEDGFQTVAPGLMSAPNGRGTLSAASASSGDNFAADDSATATKSKRTPAPASAAPAAGTGSTPAKPKPKSALEFLGFGRSGGDSTAPGDGEPAAADVPFEDKVRNFFSFGTKSNATSAAASNNLPKQSPQFNKSATMNQRSTRGTVAAGVGGDHKYGTFGGSGDGANSSSRPAFGTSNGVIQRKMSGTPAAAAAAPRKLSAATIAAREQAAKAEADAAAAAELGRAILAGDDVPFDSAYPFAVATFYFLVYLTLRSFSLTAFAALTPLALYALYVAALNYQHNTAAAADGVYDLTRLLVLAGGFVHRCTRVGLVTFDRVWFSGRNVEAARVREAEDAAAAATAAAAAAAAAEKRPSAPAPVPESGSAVSTAALTVIVPSAPSLLAGKSKLRPIPTAAAATPTAASTPVAVASPMDLANRTPPTPIPVPGDTPTATTATLTATTAAAPVQSAPSAVDAKATAPALAPTVDPTQSPALQSKTISKPDAIAAAAPAASGAAGTVAPAVLAPAASNTPSPLLSAVSLSSANRTTHPPPPVDTLARAVSSTGLSGGSDHTPVSGASHSAVVPSSLPTPSAASAVGSASAGTAEGEDSSLTLLGTPESPMSTLRSTKL